jgi:hypothetical protein
MGKANLMGMKKVLYFSKPESGGRINKENDIGIATRYQKNCPGWNKGLKKKDYLTAEVINKLKKSQFKKGIILIIQ